MAEGLTDREQFLRRIESLALSTLPVVELPLAAAAPSHHDGVMVALVPSYPENLAVDGDGALPAEDLHITLCYLGKVQNLSSFDQTKILSKARSVVNSVGRPFSTSADGVVVMGQNDEGVPATALLIQSDDIVNLYDAMADALGYESKYPSFIPHMTSGYGVPVEAAQEKVGQPIDFNTVIVKFGDAVHTIPLASSLVAAPRGANVIDRVIDSLGRLWDEALHPRDGEGKFIKKNGAISGNLLVPNKSGKGAEVFPANRASVIGFHTFDDEVWVLAELTNRDGSKSQGFARATDVKAVAPVKARLDALYPINDDDRGDAFLNASLERKRQLDLILQHINSEYGASNDEEGAFDFLETLGLWEKDLDYIMGGDLDHLGGIKKFDRELSDDEIEEQEDIIEDARHVKTLRDRVHGLKEDPTSGFSAEDAHVVPKQEITPESTPADPEVVAALQNGADPFSLVTDNLLGAMDESGRFKLISPEAETGISPIEWFTDPSDQTGVRVGLAGTGDTTGDRAYFIKQSIIGAQFGNTDIVNEVITSLIAENVKASGEPGDERLLRIPRAVFGDNPTWDGENPPVGFDMSDTHQPAHVLAEHGGYLIPEGWRVTDAASEEVRFRNDVKNLDEAAQVDQTAAFYEDIGDVYGNEVAKMILWDFAILNGDRNPGNALLAAPTDGSQGTVVPIDHGFSLDDLGPVDGILVEGMTDGEYMFDWFMNYPITLAWLNYVLGGLDLNNNVTEDTLRQIVQDFTDTYGRMDADQIIDDFRSLPGVTDEQIKRAETVLPGVVDRIAWMRYNMETVLKALTERKPLV